MKILVVDDQEDARVYLETELQSEGHEVFTAVDGVEALNLARKVLPQLVISDGLMPRMDGFELCRQMKRDEELRAIPFIFYTGTYVDRRDEYLALEIGAARFLIKPLEPKALLDAIEKVMSEAGEAVTAPPLEKRGESELIAQHRDVLARKLDKKVEQLEEQKKALGLSEARYRRLVESLGHDYFFYAHDTDGIFTYISPSIRDVLGYEPGEFMVHYAEHLTDNPANQIVDINTQAAIQGELRPPYEVEIYHKDGSTRWLEVTEFPVKDEQGEVVAIEGIAHDITRPKLAQEAVADLASKNALILESAGEGIFGLDVDGNHTFVNPAASKMLGRSIQELIGSHSHTLWHHSRPGNNAYPEEECPIYEVLRTGNRKSGQEYFIRKDGSFFPVEFVSTPIIDRGEVAGAVVSFMDVSERVKMQESMIQMEKIMSVGGLAAGMAHEINNPLGGIIQGLQNIQRRLSLELDKNLEVSQEIGLDLALVQSYLEQRGIAGFLSQIADASGRVSSIVNSMLQFARKSERVMSQESLIRLVDNTLDLAKMDYDLKKGYDFKNIEIVREYDKSLEDVPCIASEIQQVLLNLIRNAAQALQESASKPAQIKVRICREGEKACLVVEDNGPGMDEATRNCVFDPFFTTRPTGVGTGLGLSISYYIITQEHGGEMIVESAPGEGARFIIKLPLKISK
ncbi:MAG: PAS domain S-box protein [Sedimenticola sp.]